MSALVMAEAAAPAASIDPGYLRIPISSLQLDSITGFDLFLRARPGEPAVLYAERNVPFTQDSLDRLRNNNVEYLYINSAQQREYRQYLEKHLPEILSDPNVAPDEKSAVLHSTARGLVTDVFDDLDDLRSGAERGDEVLHATIDHMFAEHSAARHIIERAARDYDVYTHSVNTALYALALAQRCGYKNPRALRDLGLGALFRDIGLAQVDPAIRDNPGRLTLGQFEVLKNHTEKGEALLREHAGLSEVAMNIVRHHHEKLDGSGYPDGLAGDQISPFARIVTIVDAFDAMTTNRRHAPAMTSYHALRTMALEMRGELDADFLREFIDMMGDRP